MCSPRPNPSTRPDSTSRSPSRSSVRIALAPLRSAPSSVATGDPVSIASRSCPWCSSSDQRSFSTPETLPLAVYDAPRPCRSNSCTSVRATGWTGPPTNREPSRRSGLVEYSVVATYSRSAEEYTVSPPAVTATDDSSSGASTSKPTTVIVPAPDPSPGWSTSSQPTSRSRAAEPAPEPEPAPTVGSQSSRVLALTSARFLASALFLSVPSEGYMKGKAGAVVWVTSRIVSPYCRAESTVPEKVRSVTRVGLRGSATSSTRTRLCDTEGQVRRSPQPSSTGPPKARTP